MAFKFFGNKKREAEAEEAMPQQMKLDVRDIIAPPYIGITQNYLKLEEKITKSFFIFSYPRYLDTGWLSPVINLSVPLHTSFFIYPVSNELILKKLRKKVT